FQVSNGRLAQQLDASKSTAKNGDACTSDTCCGLFICLCTNGQLQQTVSCGAALPCQVLPLVNRAGVSPTCTSNEDKTSRIQNALNAGAAGQAPPPVNRPPPTSNFQASNGRLAQQLDASKSTAKNGDACTSDTCCGLFICLCTNGQLQQTVSCGAALPCQVLPLVNRAGVSPTCTSNEDKTSRIQNALNAGG
ncbi:hypothetical protein BC829DRAFT_344576, partial [Chytridium lagenaria]